MSARRNLYAPPTTTTQKWSQLIEHSRVKYVNKLDASGQRLASTLAWRRAQFLSSRIGRGSGDIPAEDALLLLTGHWLEMTDEKHRYGSNLKIYHEHWMKEETSENFFYWLDYGKGRHVELPGRSRENLEAQRVTYLNPHEREQHVVHVENGLLVYKSSGEPVHTLPESVEAGNEVDLSHVLPEISEKDDEATKAEKKKICRKSKYIYVTDTAGTLYVGKKVKGHFHHSSFLGGGVVCSAGGIVVNRGELIKINPKSGHYRPQQHHFDQMLVKLEGMGLSLEGVKISQSIINPRVVTHPGEGNEQQDEITSPVVPEAEEKL
ncbi:hypothetical protein BGW38_005506 [Lunasporangiospora selenospora]|uniref:Uncharacterized protein n=1 Tax=Lunasporangiospora selenospora TaxID=979761 RepID=A0A9P6FZZ7_9FUNG|nr:hypothetical protein BGW38_005506 [Lunasporangiospora selenospora]